MWFKSSKDLPSVLDLKILHTFQGAKMIEENNMLMTALGGAGGGTGAAATAWPDLKKRLFAAHKMLAFMKLSKR